LPFGRCHEGEDHRRSATRSVIGKIVPIPALSCDGIAAHPDLTSTAFSRGVFFMIGKNEITNGPRRQYEIGNGLYHYSIFLNAGSNFSRPPR
jgi:hypothetical protein